MKEILFRGKSVDSGEWVFGWYTMYPFGGGPLNVAIVPSEKAVSKERIYEQVIPETIGQYTGFTDDKSGEKIFEGDIVKVDKRSTILVGKVEFSLLFGGFTIVPKADRIESLTNKGRPKHREYEVIGNIYDNIDLL